MTDEIMRLVYVRQQERYRQQDTGEAEDINVGTFKNTDVSNIRGLAVVVYDITTKDKPGWYVARIFDFKIGCPTDCYICRRTYEEITRDIMQAFPGLIPYPRGAEDNKVILEVWM